MNKEQLKHYLKGGQFKGIYDPKRLDISNSNKLKIGRELIFNQNFIIHPALESNQLYPGQHMFSSDDIYGYIPEEDINNLEIVSSFIEQPELIPQYVYRLKYVSEDQVTKNFGKLGKNLKLPLYVCREYNHEADEHVKGLSDKDAQATSIEKMLYYGDERDTDWEQIL